MVDDYDRRKVALEQRRSSLEQQKRELSEWYEKRYSSWKQELSAAEAAGNQQQVLHLRKINPGSYATSRGQQLAAIEERIRREEAALARMKNKGESYVQARKALGKKQYRKDVSRLRGRDPEGYRRYQDRRSEQISSTLLARERRGEFKSLYEREDELGKAQAKRTRERVEIAKKWRQYRTERIRAEGPNTYARMQIERKRRNEAARERITVIDRQTSGPQYTREEIEYGLALAKLNLGQVEQFNEVKGAVESNIKSRAEQNRFWTDPAMVNERIEYNLYGPTSTPGFRNAYRKYYSAREQKKKEREEFFAPRTLQETPISVWEKNTILSNININKNLRSFLRTATLTPGSMSTTYGKTTGEQFSELAGLVSVPITTYFGGTIGKAASKGVIYAWQIPKKSSLIVKVPGALGITHLAEGLIFAKGMAETSRYVASARSEPLARQAAITNKMMTRASEYGMRESIESSPGFTIPLGREQRLGARIGDVSLFLTSREKYKKAVTSYYQEQGLSGERLSSAVKGSMRYRGSVGTGEILTYVGIDTAAELSGRSLYRLFNTVRTKQTIPLKGAFAKEFLRGGSQIFKAGIVEGASGEYAQEILRGEEIQPRAIATSGAVGGLFAFGLGGTIVASGAAGKTGRAKFLTKVGYAIDPYEWPGDIAGDIITRSARRGGMRIATPSVTITQNTVTFSNEPSSKKLSSLSQIMTRTPSTTTTSTPSPLTTSINSYSRVPLQTPSPTQTPSTSLTPIMTRTPSTSTTPSNTPSFTPSSVISPSPTPSISQTHNFVPSFVPSFTPTSALTITSTPFPRLPFMIGGGMKTYGFGSGGKSKKKRKYGYSPSLFAIEFGITSGKAPRTPSGGWTGAELRPVIAPTRKKRAKKTRKKTTKKTRKKRSQKIIKRAYSPFSGGI